VQSTTQSHIQADQWLDIQPRRIATVLHVIYRGWEMTQMRQDIQSGTDETILNECLLDGMRAVVNQEAPLGKMPKMQVHGTTETRSSPTVIKPDGAPDIPVSFPEVFESTHDLIHTPTLNANELMEVGCNSKPMLKTVLTDSSQGGMRLGINTDSWRHIWSLWTRLLQ